MQANNLLWKPCATKKTLQARARILAAIRRFFAHKNILEVETPLLCTVPVTDPFLEAMSLSRQQKSWYLQTSPEYAMKRLLCADMGSIYQISKAFRCDENGRYHHAEFTMLEWYRIGFNHHDLMAEIEVLLQFILPLRENKSAVKKTYQALFEEYFHINPHTISVFDLKKLAEQQDIHLLSVKLTKDDYLNLLLEILIKNTYRQKLLFIYDFPVSQAALAKINQNAEGQPIAERFEVYINGVELANGYHELQQVQIYRERFENDLQKRKALDLPLVPIDEKLLSALSHGLPDCAGVALGIDRLIMIALQKSSISEVLSFDAEHS